MIVKFPDNVSRNEALVRLWKGTKTIGMGFMHSHIEPTIEDTEKYFSPDTKTDLLQPLYVDYFNGRPIKVCFKDYPNLESRLYDRDAGEGTMQRVANNIADYYKPTKELNESEKNKLVDDNPIDLI